VADLRSDGYNVTRSFIWGPDFSDAHGQAGNAGALLGIYNPGYTLTYAMPDALGNIVGHINTSGNLAAAVEYSQYGRVLNSVGGLGDYPIGFSGQYTDWETGLVYYGYRYYNPKHGQFINRDPIEEQGGLNLFAFCGNNAVNGWDVLGCTVGSPGNPAIEADGGAAGLAAAISGNSLAKEFAASYAAGARDAMDEFIRWREKTPGLPPPSGMPCSFAVNDDPVRMDPVEVKADRITDAATSGGFMYYGPMLYPGALLRSPNTGFWLKITRQLGTNPQGIPVWGTDYLSSALAAENPVASTIDPSTILKGMGFAAPNRGAIDWLPWHAIWDGYVTLQELNPLVGANASLIRVVGGVDVLRWEKVGATQRVVEGVGLALGALPAAGVGARMGTAGSGALWLMGSADSAGVRSLSGLGNVGALSILRYTPDRQALIDLARQAMRRGGITLEEAGILKGWAAEYKLPFRGPEVHPQRPFGRFPHIHIGPVNHLPVRTP
jgi:RHS repeat-associated protein